METCRHGLLEAGRVLALECSEVFVGAARAAAAGITQLEVRRIDLAWCRWLAMFLPRLDPLLDLVGSSLRPGGCLVAHEYVHWNSFGLHPGGEAIARFRDAAAADAMARARQDPGAYWVGPTVLALRARRGERPLASPV